MAFTAGGSSESGLFTTALSASNVPACERKTAVVRTKRAKGFEQEEEDEEEQEEQVEQEQEEEQEEKEEEKGWH